MSFHERLQKVLAVAEVLGKHRKTIAAVILLAGLGSAICVYLTAEDLDDNNLVHQFENSKLYRHNLELVGGKASVIADEFFRWFQRLWHGKQLAYTVAFMTIIICIVFLVVGNHPPST